MKFVIYFDEEQDKDIIEYLKDADKEYKDHLRETGREAIAEYIRDEIKEKELSLKRMKCNHEYKEYKRSSYDESDGERYWDDDGNYDTVEKVHYECKHCGQYKSEFKYSDPRY